MVTLLRSRLLEAIPGVLHGFSTRRGGVSEGSFASLNLALDGEPKEVLRENRARFAAALGPFDAGSLVEVHQVHGTAVLRVEENIGGVEADGLFTRIAGRCVAVRTADCAPILLAGLDGNGEAAAVAAVHAGWRGATAGIIESALLHFDACGVPRDALVAAIGPTIGLDAFEVGDEVVDAARAALGGATPPVREGGHGRMHVDLVALIRRLLERAGVDPARIEHVGGCTYADAALYFSHRRDRGHTGRQLSAIARVQP